MLVRQLQFSVLQWSMEDIYFSLGKLFLSSQNNFSHRIFYLCLFVLSRGVFLVVLLSLNCFFFGLFSSVSNPLSLNLISEQQTRTCLVYDQRARNHQKRALCLFKDKLNLIMTARQARESFHRIHKRDLCLALVQT